MVETAAFDDRAEAARRTLISAGAAEPIATRMHQLDDGSDVVVLSFAERADLAAAQRVVRAGLASSGVVAIVLGRPWRELSLSDDDDVVADAIGEVLDQARVQLFGGPPEEPDDVRGRWRPASPDVAAYDPSDERFWVPVEPAHTSGVPYNGQVFCLGLFETATSPDALAAMHWTDGNHWPSSVHVAMARSWLERYGAEVTAADGPWMEMTVPAPIQDRKVAFEVAVEQWGYADRIGQHGYETINEVASALLVNTLWTFWWD